MLSLNPKHLGQMFKATLDSHFLCEELQAIATVQQQTPLGLEISQCILAKNKP